MSPEAALGDTLDGRSDIYALGCVAYWLLTGQPVFEATTGVQMIAKHLRNDPLAPSVRAPYQVPPELDQLVLACLAKRPDERPSTAAELSRTLSAIRVEPWTGEMARAWWEQHHPIVRSGEGASA
jgi:serine/threonine-protein kinase